MLAFSQQLLQNLPGQMCFIKLPDLSAASKKAWRVGDSSKRVNPLIHNTERQEWGKSRRMSSNHDKTKVILHNRESHLKKKPRNSGNVVRELQSLSLHIIIQSRFRVKTVSLQTKTRNWSCWGVAHTIAEEVAHSSHPDDVHFCPRPQREFRSCPGGVWHAGREGSDQIYLWMEHRRSLSFGATNEKRSEVQVVLGGNCKFSDLHSHSTSGPTEKCAMFQTKRKYFRFTGKQWFPELVTKKAFLSLLPLDRISSHSRKFSCTKGKVID